MVQSKRFLQHRSEAACNLQRGSTNWHCWAGCPLFRFLPFSASQRPKNYGYGAGRMTKQQSNNTAARWHPETAPDPNGNSKPSQLPILLLAWPRSQAGSRGPQPSHLMLLLHAVAFERPLVQCNVQGHMQALAHRLQASWWKLLARVRAPQRQWFQVHIDPQKNKTLLVDWKKLAWACTDQRCAS